MTKEVRRRHDAHLRTQGVCSEHSAFFDTTPGGRKARMTLGAHVAEVDRLLALQQRSLEDRRAATVQCGRSRRTLRHAARAVVRVGRVVELEAGVMSAMRLPGKTSDDTLLAWLRGLVDRVSAHADAFVAEGLPPDVLTDLADGVVAFEAARGAQAASRQRSSAASESIRQTLARADRTVDVLESIAITAPAAPAELLTRLRLARRVGQRARAAAPTPPVSVAPVPAPAERTA